MYQVLAATSLTLRQMLFDSMLADVGPSGLAGFFAGAGAVSLETPQEMMANNHTGLSVWLYRIARDEQRLNDPPVLRPLANGGVEIVPTPLPVRLHYLLTPIVPNNPDTEQRILGRALQLFHTYPIVTGSFLRAELAGTEAELHMHLEALGLQEITHMWEALEGSYQLSVSYEVTLSRIEVASEPRRASLVESVEPTYGLNIENELVV